MSIAKQATSTFRGLNNVQDPLRLPRGWLTQADNVDITPTGAIKRMRGFTQASTNFAVTGAYATRDFKRLFLVDAGELRQMNADLTYTVLRTGLSSARVQFEEVNGVVFYTNGVDFGVIEPSGVRSWGIAPPGAATAVAGGGGALAAGLYQFTCTLVDSRGMESGSGEVTSVVAADGERIALSDIPQTAGFTTNVYATGRDSTVFQLIEQGAGVSLTYDATTPLLEELAFQGLSEPRGSIPAEFKGVMYVAEAFPEFDQSVIWPSLPLHYHHFDIGGDGIVVPGMVRMLRACKDALICGTDRGIFAYADGTLAQLADYGVVPGWHDSRSGDSLYFWSQRGLCRALPFINLTESTVSVPPGLSAGAMVIEEDGARRYVVALHAGGEAFNRSNT